MWKCWSEVQADFWVFETETREPLVNFLIKKKFSNYRDSQPSYNPILSNCSHPLFTEIKSFFDKICKQKLRNSSFYNVKYFWKISSEIPQYGNELEKSSNSIKAISR